MKKTRKRFVPIIIAVSVVAGIIIGTFLANRFSGNRLNIINTSSNKLNDLLHIIDEQYVDTVQISDLVEKAMPQILSELDPHSSYISAQDATTANDDLRGSFSGIGVQFTIKRDTVYISNVIHGGPSEKTGILPGDRIIGVDEEPYVGEVVSNEETMHRLKGEKGTKVKLGILRHGEKRNFTITRGDIPVHSIDATYMLTSELGYIRMRNFGDTTYPELLMALAQLQQEGFKGLVIDLRGNGGGYLAKSLRVPFRTTTAASLSAAVPSAKDLCNNPSSSATEACCALRLRDTTAQAGDACKNHTLTETTKTTRWTS